MFFSSLCRSFGGSRRSRARKVPLVALLILGLGIPAAQAAGASPTLIVGPFDGAVLASGRSFPADSIVQLSVLMGSTPVQGTIASDATGRFLASITVPQGFTGTVSVTATSGVATAKAGTTVGTPSASPTATVTPRTALPAATAQPPQTAGQGQVPTGVGGSTGPSTSPQKSGDTRRTPAAPIAPANCNSNQNLNVEPEIIAGISPGPGQSVGAGGQIKVWVKDENAPFISPNEQLNPQTGVVTSAPNRQSKAPDRFLWEPALYIAPQTAENGGTPHFPYAYEGNVNNQPPNYTRGSGGISIPGIEAIPQGTAPAANSWLQGWTSARDKWVSEDIWDVNSLGLAPGTYAAEFMIFDGDKERGVGCVNITIGTAAPAPTPAPAPVVRRG